MIDNNIDLTTLYDLAAEYANLYKKELINCNAVASGRLANFTYDVELNDNYITIVYHLPTYYYQVEYGRGPSTRNDGNKVYEAILKWIDQKRIIVPRGTTKESFAKFITKRIHAGSLKNKGRYPLAKSKDKAISTGLHGRIVNEITKSIGKNIHEDLINLSQNK